MKTNRLHLAILSALLFFSGVAARAEQLPVKNYTTAENLAHDRVRAIRRDSRGFLWFGTGDGLSRFDGSSFTNYNSAQGLEQPAINDIIETPSGAYWLATNGGAVLFEPSAAAAAAAQPQFTLFQTADGGSAPLQRVNCLFEDRSGRVWAGTENGLFYFDGSLRQFRRAGFAPNAYVNHMAEDAAGDLWVATQSGLIRHPAAAAAGRTFFYQPERAFNYLYFDSEGRLWAGFDGGLLVVKLPAVSVPGADSSRAWNFVERRHALAGGGGGGRLDLPETKGDAFVFTGGGAENSLVIKILPAGAEGRVWIVTRNDGAFELENGILKHYTAEQGLKDSTLSAAETDAAGNVWLGTETSGALRIARHGFTTFSEADGLGRIFVRRVFETKAGEIIAVRRTPDWWRFDGARFAPLKLNLPPNLGNLSETGNEAPFQTGNGEWWVATPKGLFRFPAVENLDQLAKVKPLAVYTEKNGLPNPNLVTVWEDSRGDLWVGTRGKIRVSRWERATGKFYGYAVETGSPSTAAAEEPPLAFAEDRAGNVWVGFKTGGLARFQNGRFRVLTEADGVPAGTIPSLYIDHAGRLWVPAHRGGVMRIDNPAEENFKFQIYTPTNGLSSVSARCVTEDLQGRFYIGTVRGVDRLTPETGEIKHFTVADGLGYSETGNCFRDSRGALWFASYRGLSKFVPETDVAPPLSAPLINGLRVAGERLPVAELGQAEVVLPDFDHRQNNLQIDFFSINFAAADQVRYQYRLGGAANNDWSRPTPDRTVTFANLAPGDYEFAVRAVNADGLTSRNPAVVRFKILPPVWRQWWFITLCVLAAASLFFALERYRAAGRRDLKAAFDEIKISETRFRRLLEQSPLGTVIFAPDGRVRSVNRAYERFWGVTYEQIKDRDFLSDPQIVASGVADGLRRAFAGEFVAFEPAAYVPRENGTAAAAGVEIAPDGPPVKWILAFAYPVKNDAGKLREVVLVMEDITEKKTAEENLEKVRAEKARELEQVRKRIAADLHDDIGSSLTQISILSEVLRQNDGRTDGGDGGSDTLDSIAASSRELVDAMSDIVWAINPQKDRLSDLTGKMRRFAADSFTPRRIKFAFEAPDLTRDLPLGANLRREVFLIFKEAVNNIVKHAGCRAVEIAFKIERDEILLTVRDDGCGLAASSEKQNGGGHGLSSMTERANSLGGSLKINSSGGGSAGTEILIVVPLNSAAPGGGGVT